MFGVSRILIQSSSLAAILFIFNLIPATVCAHDHPGHGVTVKLTKQMEPIREFGEDLIFESYEKISQSIGWPDQLRTAVNFMGRREFSYRTKAPKWVGALFHRGEILIPVSSTNLVGDKLKRSVTHELVHAVVREHSKGRCAVWIDEGLAQILEGEIEQGIYAAFTRVKQSVPVPRLADLHENFMGFSREESISAYSRSYSATKILIERYGWSAMQSYLQGVGSGLSHEVSFERGFGITEEIFEQSLQSLDWGRTVGEGFSL